MTLLNPIVSVPPEQLAAQSVVDNANSLLAMLTNRYQSAYNRVWNNKAATPDNIIAAMGTQAQAIFTHSAAWRHLLTASDKHRSPPRRRPAGR